jgi:hypothetical protein
MEILSNRYREQCSRTILDINHLLLDWTSDSSAVQFAVLGKYKMFRQYQTVFTSFGWKELFG